MQRLTQFVGRWMDEVKLNDIQSEELNNVGVDAQGHLKAETDLNKYPTGDWIFFGWIDKLSIVGTGTFDGQGASIWHLNDCQQNQKCKLLPTVSINILLSTPKVESINQFHISLVSVMFYLVLTV